MHVIVTKLHRADHGELEARVSIGDGRAVPVTRRFGSWGTVPDGGRWRQLLPEVAIELQKRAREFEGHEAKAVAA